MLLMTLAPTVVEAPSLDDGPLRLTDQTAAEIETMAVLYEAVELHIEAQLGQAGTDARPGDVVAHTRSHAVTGGQDQGAALRHGGCLSRASRAGGRPAST